MAPVEDSLNYRTHGRTSSTESESSDLLVALHVKPPNAVNLTAVEASK
jgi:hypothetical protein